MHRQIHVARTIPELTALLPRYFSCGSVVFALGDVADGVVYVGAALHPAGGGGFAGLQGLQAIEVAGAYAHYFFEIAGGGGVLVLYFEVRAC